MKYYDGYVIAENEEPEYLSEPMPCNSAQEYADTVIALMQDAWEPDDHDAEDVICQKLVNRDYTVEYFTEDDVEYATVYVRVQNPRAEQKCPALILYGSRQEPARIIYVICAPLRKRVHGVL